MSIANSLIQLAMAESVRTAVEKAQRIRDVLEDLMKIGTPLEVQSASFLLSNVDRSIEDILAVDRTRNMIWTKCSHCGKEKACTLIRDPYIEEVSPEDSSPLNWWCEECANERRDDI